MSRLEKEQARYEQEYVAGSRTSQSNPATGIFLGALAVAVSGLGAWLVFAQTHQTSTGDTDVITVPVQETPKPDINLPKSNIDILNPSKEKTEPSSDS